MSAIRTTWTRIKRLPKLFALTVITFLWGLTKAIGFLIVANIGLVIGMVLAPFVLSSASLRRYADTVRRAEDRFRSRLTTTAPEL
jgi:hypothetical protein